MANIGLATEEGVNYAVTVEGLQELRRDLMAVEPKLAYKLNSRLRRVGNMVAGDARTLTGRLAEIGPDSKTGRPSTIGSKTGEAVSGIKVKMGATKSNRNAVVRVEQGNKYGAIVEFAEAGKSPQGRAFVRMLDRHFGSTGRFIWEAADQNRVAINAEVALAVLETEREFENKLGI